MFKHGEASKRDGTRPSAEYRAWCYMKARCLGYHEKDRKCYTERGITVCTRWLGPQGFVHFLADMGRKPAYEFTLDRIDNDRGYFPKNCRWATRKQQIANRRKCIREQKKHDWRASSLHTEIRCSDDLTAAP